MRDNCGALVLLSSLHVFSLFYQNIYSRSYSIVIECYRVLCFDGQLVLLSLPVTTAWRVLRFRIEERPPIWRVAANKLNKQSWTADKGWSSSLGVVRGANNPSLQNIHVKKQSLVGCFLWRTGGECL